MCAHAHTLTSSPSQSNSLPAHVPQLKVLIAGVLSSLLHHIGAQLLGGYPEKEKEEEKEEEEREEKEEEEEEEEEEKKEEEEEEKEEEEEDEEEKEEEEDGKRESPSSTFTFSHHACVTVLKSHNTKGYEQMHV